MRRHPGLRVRYRIDGRRRDADPSPATYQAENLLDLVPKRWDVAHRGASLCLLPDLLERAFGASIDRVWFPRLLHEDAALVRLLDDLEREVRAGCPQGRVYGESVALAIYARALRQAAHRPEGPPPDCLPDRRLAAVVDYIHAHVADDLALHDLAALAGMSTWHFARRFKQTVGLAPHRYVLKVRVDRAVELLRSPATRSCADVACAVGFADQSHFARVFKRLTGRHPRDCRP